MKLKINRGGAGFTLIEILVGISIVITTSTIVIAILVSSFRTSSKTTAGDIVRHNGNNAITQLSKIIQFADGFDQGVSADGNTYVKLCLVTASGYKYISLFSSGKPKIIRCLNSGIAIDGEEFLDSNKIIIVPESCKFTCSQKNSTETPVIGISFSLKSGAGGSSSTLPEKNTVINFKTSVKMRNQ